MKKLLFGIAGVLIGLALGMAYGHMQLTTSEKLHQTKLKEATQRLSLTQRRFNEERTNLEDSTQALQTKLDDITKEKEKLLAEKGQLTSKLQASDAKASSLEKNASSLASRITVLDTKNSQLTEHVAKLETEHAALDKKQKTTQASLEAREKELRQLNIDSHKQYEQCADDNARLCEIARDLIHKYEDKGFLKTLVSNEPFIQIKKVELEKLMQDYKDRIDQHKLK